ncbi:MAG: hypothetical protein WKH68_12160 [Candidatus Limnocylindria bacterium]
MYANLRVVECADGEFKREWFAARVLVDAGGIEVTADLGGSGQSAELGKTQVLPLGTELIITADF